ncbi:MAG: prephenate dehydrogenase dimerization domain-containing protein, partial [Polyangia bacterium]
SHLPHVAAYVLMGALADLPPSDEQVARGLPTTSLRDTSRVAGSSPVMWKDIFLENAPALLPLIDRLAAELDALKTAISAGDEARLGTLLETGRTTRARFFPE